jgi:butyrate kinase
VFRDVLQNTTESLVPQGIGVAGTIPEGPYQYQLITVTLDGILPGGAQPGVTVSCTDLAGNGDADCPAITNITGSFTGPYSISLSGPPPVRECITLSFAGALPAQSLKYQVLPGDTNLDGLASTQDLLFLVQRINDGSASQSANLARYDINRSQEPGGAHVNTQDMLRLVQLLNGTNATQAFNGATVAPCP